MQINDITSVIIGSAIKVHQFLGPGLLESAYRVCLAYELKKAGLSVVQEKPIPVVYQEVKLECGFRADLFVESFVIVECKAREKLHPIDSKYSPKVWAQRFEARAGIGLFFAIQRG